MAVACAVLLLPQGSVSESHGSKQVFVVKAKTSTQNMFAGLYCPADRRQSVCSFGFQIQDRERLLSLPSPVGAEPAVEGSTAKRPSGERVDGESGKIMTGRDSRERHQGACRRELRSIGRFPVQRTVQPKQSSNTKVSLERPERLLCEEYTNFLVTGL